MNASIQIVADAFERLLRPDSEVIKLAGGMTFLEGPVWVPAEDALVFSDVPANRMMRWSPERGLEVYREPTGFANGNAIDREGRLVSCETGGRRVTRTEADGSVVEIAGTYRGRRFNSPNDIVVKSDGTVWFTDPDYGLRNPTRSGGAAKEMNGNYVFRLDPADDAIEIAARDFVQPNGLAFSPGEDALYVADSGLTSVSGGPHHIRAFDVVDGRRLANSRVFCEVSPHVPDGFRVDEHGNVFTSAGDGVQVFDREGKLIGKLLTPETAANCAFGGPGGRTLFITARASLYAVDLNTAGATWQGPRIRRSPGR